jgi:hypothetical protein
LKKDGRKWNVKINIKKKEEDGQSVIQPVRTAQLSSIGPSMSVRCIHTKRHSRRAVYSNHLPVRFQLIDIYSDGQQQQQQQQL